MKIVGNHEGFDFRIDNSQDQKRLNIYNKQAKEITSIAAKVYENKAERNDLSLWDKVKLKLHTAFSWKWVKADDNTIVNVNSLAQRTGLGKDVIRESARTGKLTEKITERLSQIELEEKIKPLKKFPVKNHLANRLLGSAAGYADRTIQIVQIYWIPDSQNMLVAGDYLKKPQIPFPFETIDDITNYYVIPAKVYREDGELYLMLDSTEMTHKGPPPTEERKEQIRSEIHQFISTEDPY
jgi:hypothetical protein